MLCLEISKAEVNLSVELKRLILNSLWHRERQKLFLTSSPLVAGRRPLFL